MVLTFISVHSQSICMIKDMPHPNILYMMHVNIGPLYHHQPNKLIFKITRKLLGHSSSQQYVGHYISTYS